MMKNKLTVRLITVIVLSISLLAGIMAPIYFYLQPRMYIKQEARYVADFSQRLKAVEPFEGEALKEFFDNSNVAYRVYVFDEDFNPVFTSLEMGNNKKFLLRLFGDKLEQFSETSTPAYAKIDDESAIRLYTSCTIEGKTYYINIKNNLSGVGKVFSLSNKILSYVVAGYVIICSVILFLAISPSVKAVREVTKVAKDISENNLSVRYQGRIRKNEIGDLALSINKMADTIQDNINSLENYNFVLREDYRYMAEHEELRRTLLRNITHDLKTPLAVISSQVEMIRTCDEQEKKDYYYESAMEEISKMSHMISEVLQMTVDERRIEYKESQHINASDIITELCNNNSAYIKSCELELITDITPNLQLNTIRKYMEFVFRNYLANAVQNAVKKSAIVVSLKEADGAIRLSVENTGKHIPEEMEDKIWTETFTTSPSGKENSGLGLYIVKEISLIEHTRCGFDNTEKGVRFWFDFVNYPNKN
ncbi:MAG: HAMP domain-containing histidine kinase [Ruminococcaceae bacterium]|nr:HAMP domain-containing histidine kinase [Oscillospiraceae bacterium]